MIVSLSDEVLYFEYWFKFLWCKIRNGWHVIVLSVCRKNWV